MADYWGVAEDIAQQITNYGFPTGGYFLLEDGGHLVIEGGDGFLLIENVSFPASVSIEEELTMDEYPRVFIYRENRLAPDDWQNLNASNEQGIRIHCNFSIWCFAYGINIKRAMETRDRLLGTVELALMSDTKFGREDVIASWLEGGEFDYALMQPGLNVGAEIKLLVVLDTRLTDISLDLEDGGFLLFEGDEDGNHLELQ